MRCSLIAANAVTSKNRRGSGLITGVTLAVVLALAAGCGTRPPAGQPGLLLRAVLTASVTSPGGFLHVPSGHRIDLEQPGVTVVGPQAPGAVGDGRERSAGVRIPGCTGMEGCGHPCAAWCDGFP